MYYGDIRIGETIDIKFTTRSFATSAPTTLAGTPVISAYVGNSETQITAGITLSVDFDSVTGLNNIRVVASGANGYATATNIILVITTGTVGGVSVVGEVVGAFSIECRSAVMPTTAGRKLDVSANGEAGLDWGNIGNQNADVTFGGTSITSADFVNQVTGSVGSVEGLTASNLDATVSSRLATSGYTAPDNTTITAINTKTTNLPVSPAAVGSPMTLDLTQVVPTSNTANTHGDCLNAARAQGFGKWVITGTTLKLYAADGTTVVRTFTLDSSTAPTQRV